MRMPQTEKPTEAIAVVLGCPYIHSGCREQGNHVGPEMDALPLMVIVHSAERCYQFVCGGDHHQSYSAVIAVCSNTDLPGNMWSNSTNMIAWGLTNHFHPGFEICSMGKE